MKRMLSLLLVLVMVFGLSACSGSGKTYKEAKAAFDSGDYEKSAELFESLGDYKDSQDLAKESKYQLSCSYLWTDGVFSGKPLFAISIFEELGDYKDSKELWKRASAQTGIETYLASTNNMDETTLASLELAVSLMEQGEGREDTEEMLRSAKVELLICYVLLNGKPNEGLLAKEGDRMLTVDSKEFKDGKISIICNEKLGKLGILTLEYYQLVKGDYGISVLSAADYTLEEGEETTFKVFFIINAGIAYTKAGAAGTVRLSDISSIRDYNVTDYTEEIKEISRKIKKKTQFSFDDNVSLNTPMERYAEVFSGVERILAEQVPYDITMKDLLAIEG